MLKTCMFADSFSFHSRVFDFRGPHPAMPWAWVWLPASEVDRLSQLPEFDVKKEVKKEEKKNKEASWDDDASWGPWRSSQKEIQQGPYPADPKPSATSESKQFDWWASASGASSRGSRESWSETRLLQRPGSSAQQCLRAGGQQWKVTEVEDGGQVSD